MICVIAENDGTILSAHCLGCKAGLAGSHIASVLFYLEAATRIHGKLACTQNYQGIFPLMSMKCRILGLRTSIVYQLKRSGQTAASLEPYSSFNSSSGTASAGALARIASAPSKEEMAPLYVKLNQCKIKAVALCLIDPFADQFIDKVALFR